MATVTQRERQVCAVLVVLGWLTALAMEPEPDWKQRYEQIRREVKASATVRKPGEAVTLERRVGGDVTGAITAISSNTVTVNGTVWTASQFTSKTCRELFPELYAAQRAAEQVQVERAAYRARQAAELQKQAAVDQQARLEQAARAREEEARQAQAAQDRGPLAKAVREMTGRRTKIIWLRGSRDDGGKLMCFDTNDGKERVLVDKADDPRLTPDGTRILFCRRSDQTAYIINWDGTGLRKILEGRYYNVLGLAKDPRTGTEWVYVGDCWGKEAMAEIKEKGIQASDDSGLKMFRHRLDDLPVNELVWDKIPFNRRTYVTPDGSQLYGELPWPNCGVGTLPNGQWTLIGQGCNGALAPDGSGMFFHLIGDHQHIKIYDKNGAPMGGLIAVNGMPGNEKDPRRAVWRPRWSNDVRFFAIQSADLGPDADISLGEFDETFTRVKNWVRITDTPEYDADGQAWIEPVGKSGGQR